MYSWGLDRIGMFNEDLKRLQQEGGILISVEDRKRRGRSKVTWMEVERNGMEKLRITSKIVLNRKHWPIRIPEANTKWLGMAMVMLAICIHETQQEGTESK